MEGVCVLVDLPNDFGETILVVLLGMKGLQCLGAGPGGGNPLLDLGDNAVITIQDIIFFLLPGIEKLGNHLHIPIHLVGAVGYAGHPGIAGVTDDDRQQQNGRERNKQFATDRHILKHFSLPPSHVCSKNKESRHHRPTAPTNC